MRAQQDDLLRKVLQKEFERIREKNPSYSLRAFGKKLGISSSMLWQVLNGERNASPRLAQRVLEHIEMDDSTRAQLVQQFAHWKRFKTRRRLGARETTREAVEIPGEQYALVSEWQHFAILSLAETKSFVSDPAWIAERLGIPARLAAESIERLVQFGLILRGPNGQLAPTGKSYGTTNEVVNFTLRKAHQRNFELAKISIDVDPLELRDFRAMTVAIDPGKLPEAKERLRAFRDRFCKWLEKGEKKEVYKVCLALFPLSRDGGKTAGGKLG